VENQIAEKEAASLIDLSQRRASVEDKKENDSLSRYFKVLSFSELIDETSKIIEELNRVGSTDEIIRQSKLILKELGLRITNSKGLSENFLKMKQELEDRLKSL